MSAKVQVRKKVHLQLIAFSAAVLARYPQDRVFSLFNKLVPDVVGREKLLAIPVLFAEDKAG
jgi:propanediol dehydratase small subunit